MNFKLNISLTLLLSVRQELAEKFKCVFRVTIEISRSGLQLGKVW